MSSSSLIGQPAAFPVREHTAAEMAASKVRLATAGQAPAHLEHRSGAATIVGLANAELDHARDAVLDHWRHRRTSANAGLRCNSRACWSRTSCGWTDTVRPPW